MSVDFDTAGDGTGRTQTNTSTATWHEWPPITLEMVTVAYTDGPNESTIFPPEAEGMERMSTWITANEPDVVDLLDAC